MPAASRAARRASAVSLLFLAFAALRACGTEGSLGTPASYGTLAARVRSGWGDPASWLARHYDRLKARLPPGEPLAFLSDHSLGLPQGLEEYCSRLFLAQYSMLPHVLVEPERARFVVGYWHDAAAAAPLLAERGYRLVLDAGGGITLHAQRWP
jgi:hypothetical protein